MGRGRVREDGGQGAASCTRPAEPLTGPLGGLRGGDEEPVDVLGGECCGKLGPGEVGGGGDHGACLCGGDLLARSEERRVGKESRCAWSRTTAIEDRTSKVNAKTTGEATQTHGR